ncbi:MAG: toprim domain-containing protein [Geobacter sp.]|nr:toprim domain-containing protein [Geobacter sp.]
MNQDVYQAIQSACFEIGLTPPPADAVIFDGRIHRYHDPNHDKHGEQNGWIKAADNGNGSSGGTVGHWKLGCKKNWTSRDRREFSPAEKAAYAKQMQEVRQREEEERQRFQERVSQKAETLWKQARQADYSHPYLVRKGVKPHGIRQLAQSLVVPLRDSAGVLWSLQFIDGDGGKRFLSGGRTAGCYWSVGPAPAETLLISEGAATACTLFEATGYPVAAAMNAGNMKAVALALREKFLKIRLLLCADADPVGREKAQAAADAVRGIVIEPDFEGVPCE